jgi:hypothetical protein
MIAYDITVKKGYIGSNQLPCCVAPYDEIWALTRVTKNECRKHIFDSGEGWMNKREKTLVFYKRESPI